MLNGFQTIMEIPEKQGKILMRADIKWKRAQDGETELIEKRLQTSVFADSKHDF